MSQPLMKQADEQGRDHTLRRHLAWSGPPPPATRARAEAAALLSTLRHAHPATVAPEAVDDVRLVISELIANAARHAPGPGHLDIEAAEHGSIVRITVHDTSPAIPHPQSSNPHRVGGHGLEIVRALSLRLLVQQTSHGKQITAEIPLHRPRSPARSRRHQADGTPDDTVR